MDTTSTIPQNITVRKRRSSAKSVQFSDSFTTPTPIMPIPTTFTPRPTHLSTYGRYYAVSALTLTYIPLYAAFTAGILSASIALLIGAAIGLSICFLLYQNKARAQVMQPQPIATSTHSAFFKKPTVANQPQTIGSGISYEGETIIRDSSPERNSSSSDDDQDSSPYPRKRLYHQFKSPADANNTSASCPSSAESEHTQAEYSPYTLHLSPGSLCDFK